MLRNHAFVPSDGSIDSHILGKCSVLCGVNEYPKDDGIGAGENQVKDAQASDENFLLE